MRVTILDGGTHGPAASFDAYVDRLSQSLSDNGHDVTVLALREMDIKHCTGCFGCWVKNPGECVVDDDSRQVRRAVIHSDFVLCASPVIMGFYSAELKKVTDKLIPLIHPYAEFVEGEVHHLARYDSYPVMGLLLDRRNADDEDIQIISAIHRRTALNFKTTVAFTHLTSDPVDEVADAVTRALEARAGGGGRA